MRGSLETYLGERGYNAQTFPNYDVTMEEFEPRTADALVVDVQGVPRGESGTNFPQFNQWLARIYEGNDPPALVYLLRKGSRRPHFRLEGIVIKKPFPFEKLGEALRNVLGHPPREQRRPFEVDMASNALRGSVGDVHLTNIEASLLTYLMEHEGEILHPRLLLTEVWRYHDAAGASTLVRAHVSNLRRKMRGVLGSDEQIETIRGKGYRFIA